MQLVANFVDFVSGHELFKDERLLRGRLKADGHLGQRSVKIRTHD